MPANIAPALGFVGLAVTGGLAVYYWRRATGLYSLLVEGANRFEELRHRSTQLEQLLAKDEEKFKTHRDSTGRLTQAMEDARDKAVELTRRLELKEHEARLVEGKLELQKGHLEKQLTKTLDMLRIAEEQRLEATTGTRERIATLEQELILKDKDWQVKLRDLERDKAAIERKAKDADPIELKKLKRKIAQYDRLYASMKGLREMSEERNRNWEVALRKLSAWVLESRGKSYGNSDLSPQAPIGPLVAKAMQSIGAQLLDENEPDTASGASRAAAMDDSSDGELDLDAAEQEAATSTAISTAGTIEQP